MLTSFIAILALPANTDVMDMVFAASSDPSEAVSALAGMSFTTADGDEAQNAGKGPASSTRTPKATSNNNGSNNTSVTGTGDGPSGNIRRTMTVEGMHAHRASTVVGSPCSDEGVARTESVKEAAGGGVSSTAELEKVAAFISSYAGAIEN